MNAWSLCWSHGDGWVDALGGMLGPMNFRLPAGRTVQPFAVFPWADEPLPAGEQALTGLMSRGRGEWPCVPFGINPDPAALGWDHPIHGEAAHHPWQRVDDGRDSAQIRLRYACAADSPIESLERQLRAVAGEATIECSLVVRARRHCALPIGLHPTLRMPARPGALRLDPGRFMFARSFPREVEPGADIVAADQTFDQLSDAPRRDGGTVDLYSLPPAEATESLVQLCGVDGVMCATYLDEGFRFKLIWDARQLPSCLLWISNGGRSAWPWNRRHFALGIEPVCTAFDQGVVASTQANPISERGVATAVPLDPATPLEIRYRMGVESTRTDAST